MAIFQPIAGQTPIPQTAALSRRDLKLDSQRRLSGWDSADPYCNPTNLSLTSFSRVSHIDFDETTLIAVTVSPAPVDDFDW